MLPQEFNLMNFYTGTFSAGSDMFASLILFFFFLYQETFCFVVQFTSSKFRSRETKSFMHRLCTREKKHEWYLCFINC